MQGIKIYPNTKIYIPAPLGMRSGGPTLLYQLASAIIKNSTGGGWSGAANSALRSRLEKFSRRRVQRISY